MAYSDTAHDRYFEQMENEFMSIFYTQEEIDEEDDDEAQD